MSWRAAAECPQCCGLPPGPSRSSPAVLNMMPFCCSILRRLDWAAGDLVFAPVGPWQRLSIAWGPHAWLLLASPQRLPHRLQSAPSRPSCLHPHAAATALACSFVLAVTSASAASTRPVLLGVLFTAACTCCGSQLQAEAWLAGAPLLAGRGTLRQYPQLSP